MYNLNYNRSRVNWFQFFMQKLSLKSVHVLCKRCRSADKEDNKIGFAFLRFSVILYEFSKPLDLRVKTLRIYFHSDPRKFWNLTDMPLGLAKGSLRVFSLHRCALRRGRGGREFAASEVGPMQANKKVGVWFSSPQVDWSQCFGRRELRWAAAARSRQWSRDSQKFGAKRGRGRPCDHVGARVNPRDEAQVFGRLR
jgi:hypothetical protein